MAKLEKLQALGVVSETTQGTAVACVVTTDYIPLVEKPTIKPIVEIMQRANFAESLGKLPFSTGWSYTDVTFKIELLGASASNTAYLPLDALFKACGMTVTGGTAGSDWTYALSSTTVANFLGAATSCTIEFYSDGLKHIIQGCIGTFKLVGEAGQTPMGEFSMKGLYTAVTDTALPNVTFRHNAVIPKMKSAALTLNGGGAGSIVGYCQKVEIELGNKIEFVPDVSTAGGLAGFRIVDREPKASINPEMSTVANFDWWARYVAGTGLTTTAGLSVIFGNGVRNFLTASCPNVQVLDAKYGTRNGIVTMEPDLQLNNTAAGNDAFNIVVDNDNA